MVDEAAGCRREREGTVTHNERSGVCYQAWKGRMIRLGSRVPASRKGRGHKPSVERSSKPRCVGEIRGGRARGRRCWSGD